MENGKSERHYRILQNQINLGSTFHFKLTILNFWTKIAQKGNR